MTTTSAVQLGMHDAAPVANLRAWSGWPAVAVGVAAVVIALLFRLTLPAGAQANESADYTTFYEPVARSLLAGDGFTFRAGQPATAYPPGHPVMLAGVFWLAGVLGVSEGTALAVVAALVMGIGSALLWGVARRVWSPRAALLAPLLWMTYPFALWLTKQPNSELPFLVALFGAWYVLWRAVLQRSRRWPLFFLCGILVGIAMLIRPIAIGVGVLFGLLLWGTRRDLEPRVRAGVIGLLLLGNLVAVLPWEVWLYRQTSGVVLLSTNGPASIQDGLTFAVNPGAQRQPTQVSAGVAAVMQRVQARSGQLTSLGAVAAVMWAELRTHPIAVGELVALKAARSWYGTDSGRQETAIPLIQAVYLLIFLAASYAAWTRGGPARQLTVGVWLLVLYFWGMTVLALSILRYMVPAIGLLFLLTPALVPRWVERAGSSGPLPPGPAPIPVT